MTEKKSKVCSKCKQEKLLCDFVKDTTKKLGFTSQCKKCKKERHAKYRQENPEKIKESGKKYYQKNFEKIKGRNAKYYQKNSEQIKGHRKKYRQENLEKIKEREAKYYQENSEKIKKSGRKYQNKRYKNDENFRITSILRARLSQALKSQSAKKSKRTLELVGCRIDELWEHLEKQFKDGMTRQNQGEWHIDHIKPCASFNLTDPEQQKECFNYKNLQPLWAIDNMKKGSKI